MNKANFHLKIVVNLETFVVEYFLIPINRVISQPLVIFAHLPNGHSLAHIVRGNKAVCL